MNGINRRNKKKKKKNRKKTKEKSADEGYERVTETRGKRLTYSRALSSILYCHNLSLLYITVVREYLRRVSFSLRHAF